MFEHFFFARELSLLAIMAVMFLLLWVNYAVSEIKAGSYPTIPFLKPSIRYRGRSGPDCSSCAHYKEDVQISRLSQCTHPLAQHGIEAPRCFFVRGETTLCENDSMHRKYIKVFGVCGLPGILYKPKENAPANRVTIIDVIQWMVVRYALVQDFMNNKLLRYYLQTINRVKKQLEKEIINLDRPYKWLRRKPIFVESYADALAKPHFTKPNTDLNVYDFSKNIKKYKGV